jgi:hypothetical protein
MLNANTGEYTCDVCLNPIVENGVLLTRPVPGFQPCKTVHSGKCELESPFHELTASFTLVTGKGS